MDLLTVPEVADVLRVPRARAYDLVKQGLIPAVRVGRQIRVDAAALRRWIQAGGRSLPNASQRGETVETSSGTDQDSR